MTQREKTAKLNMETRKNAIAKLNAGEAVDYSGTRIVREGMDWCITHANGAFESFPESGADRVSAAQIIDRTDLLAYLDEKAIRYPAEKHLTLEEVKP